MIEKIYTHIISYNLIHIKEGEVWLYKQVNTFK